MPIGVAFHQISTSIYAIVYLGHKAKRKLSSSLLNDYDIFSLHIVGQKTEKAGVIEVRCAEKVEGCNLSSEAWQQ